MNADSDKARISYPEVSSYFHFLETIDISNTCFVFSFITDYTDLVHGKIYSMDELPTSQAMLLSFLAGPMNLRKFNATRPEGTRQPDF